jgi:hypothetical protein
MCEKNELAMRIWHPDLGVLINKASSLPEVSAGSDLRLRFVNPWGSQKVAKVAKKTLYAGEVGAASRSGGA